MHRTAFKHFEPSAEYIAYCKAEKIKPHDSNRVCPMCKAHDCSAVNDQVHLAKYAEFYKTKTFTVYQCGVCDYEYSVYRG